MKELDLYVSEREELANKQLLSDKHIHAAVTLLKREFPEITGNQSTLLSQTKSFQQMGEGSIQIHHDNNRKHWVTSTMRTNEVIVYDSKSICGISEDIKEQIKQIYGVPCRVAVPRITQQRGSKDCGLYAIAYAWYLAQGESPQNVVFNQKQMRDHFRYGQDPKMDENCQ